MTTRGQAFGRFAVTIDGDRLRGRSLRGVAEEATGAYKDVAVVVAAAEAAGLGQRVARLVPLACIKG